MNDARHFLVVSHTGRQNALEATGQVCTQLLASGAVPVIAAEHWDDVHTFVPELDGAVKRFEEVDPSRIELVIVLGGDGTILRAAELMREHPIPLLGVNLGHVGFLAESERDDLGYTVARALARDYAVEERMTLSVRAKVGEEVVYESWALNEATVEKAERERMLEVVVEVDRRPLSSFGCDGIVMSTPTGSTAYSFSARGPIVSPSVDVLVVTAVAPHMVFDRSFVLGGEQMVTLEVVGDEPGLLSADGRDAVELAVGATVRIRRADQPARFVRRPDAPPFVARVRDKFDLPGDPDDGA